MYSDLYAQLTTGVEPQETPEKSPTPEEIEPNHPFDYLFIFGDSLTSIGFQESSPEPSEDNPMGVPFPGQNYAMPNWVGHLLQDHMDPIPFVYDYAVPGARVGGVAAQVQRFMRRPGMNNANVPWTGSNSLFIAWVGTNDITFGSNTAEYSLKGLFALHNTLYNYGARIFMVVNIPPFPPTTGHHNEADANRHHEERQAKVLEWNTRLERFVEDFRRKHADSTMFLCDVFGTYTRIKADPIKYGFQPGTGIQRDRDFYLDHIHPTTAVHKVIAQDIWDILTAKEDEPEIQEMEQPVAGPSTSASTSTSTGNKRGRVSSGSEELHPAKRSAAGTQFKHWTADALNRP